MSPIFEIMQKDCAGRIGRLETRHGIIETPTIMPVINPNIQTITSSELRKIGAQIVITNSYIIYRKPELKERAMKHGLHSLIGFDGPIMTDSGSYQLSVYGEVEVNNKEIVEFQQCIGSDIGVPLDIPTPPDVSRSRAEYELEETMIREKEALGLKKDMLLAAPVQGSTYPDLRERCAHELNGLDFDIFPLGAVVPLMESYRYGDLVDIIAASKKGLTSAAPVHLFGAGHPMMFSLAVALGCDLFDSASYALYAKDGRYMTPRGTYHIEQLQYLPCCCPVCSAYNPRELFESEQREELLARHNLYATFAEINEIKQAIHEGSLWELVEQRCRAHPHLLSGLRRALSEHSVWIEEIAPLSRSTFFYSGPESSHRPEVQRHRKKLRNLKIEGKVLVRTRKLVNENEFDWIFDFKAPFGPFPLELRETFPLNAEVVDEPDHESLTAALTNLIELMEQNPDCEFSIMLDGLPDHPLRKKFDKNYIKKIS